MLKISKWCIFILLFVCSSTSIAQQVIKIGVGNFPPFFIEKGQKGIFIEIIDEIFEQLPQYKVQYQFMSNHRILHEINYGHSIDVASNIFPNSKLNAHLSQPIFRYRDVAISKKSAQLTINKISDLQGRSIAAYQGATELLGKEFKLMAEANPAYSEHAHPKESTQQVLSGRKDIRIGDINIFRYDLNNKYYDQKINTNYSNFTVHYLWPYIYSHMAFKNKYLRDKVDEIMVVLKDNGTLDAIYKKHNMH